MEKSSISITDARGDWNLIMAYTPSSYVLQLVTSGPIYYVAALLASIVISGALVGLFIGWVLGKWGEGRYVAAGSVIYYTAYFINLYWRYRYSFQEFIFRIPAFQTLSDLFIFSGAVVLFLPIGYAIRKHTLKRTV